MRRYRWLVAALVAGALAACGGDDEPGTPTDSAKPELTVPGESTSSETTDPESTESTESTGTAPSEAPPTGPMDQPNPGNGGVPAPDSNNPSGGQRAPDSPDNDTPPEPGSPQERFEQFCAENPGAC